MKKITPSISHDQLIARLENIAHSMDAKWVLPGTSIRLGWDTLIGLIPGIGDTITSMVSAYIIKEAHHVGVPFWIKFRMVINILIDWLIGIVPLVGDIFDVGFKANIRNVSLIKRHLESLKSV